MTLTDFLLARVAEDERRATVNRDADALSGSVAEDYEFEGYNSPARVLAECKAKRRIVDLHSQAELIYVCRICGTSETSEDRWPCRTLLALASVHADHLDYREEWRPTP